MTLSLTLGCVKVREFHSPYFKESELMFEEMTKFFGNDPDAHVFEADNSGVVLVTSTRGMQVLPVQNEDFRIGPYIFKCIICTDRVVVGHIATPTL